MKRILSFVLVIVLIFSVCGQAFASSEEPEEAVPEFRSLSDPDLLRYIEDDLYSNLVSDINSDEYFIENVSAVYISKEYLEELAYNSQANIFFGYTLDELNEQFQGTRYVFTLGEDGSTVVQPFENFDDTYERVIRNVAIGTGVILVCVTVSVVTGGLGAPAVSMIFAASAKSAAIFAASSGALSGVVAGAVKGYETKDFNESLKAAALAGSESFKWGAITGAIGGGATEAIALKGATLNGLTMNEAALIQRESGYPLDVIKEFQSMEQYNICRDAGIYPEMINGKTALLREIDLNQVDEIGRTNAQRIAEKLAPLDPDGIPYELHHIGQHTDSTLAILTREEHRIGENYTIWHDTVESGTGVHAILTDAQWASQKQAFWDAYLVMFGGV